MNPTKACTGIEGFDAITQGGLPRGRVTLIEGGPGAGKTIMALQTLVNGASLENEPAIFVAFEESSERIVSNAAKFGWELPALQQQKKLFILDAKPTAELVQSGDFDLGGLLAVLDAKIGEIQARRIVFDALDVVLALLGDPAAERREVYRLNEWLLARGLTAIFTAKGGNQDAPAVNQPHLGFMQFMVDCAVLLRNEVVLGVSQRNVRVLKYRGSAFTENESPFLIGAGGLEVAGTRLLGREEPVVTTERVSSGVERLDAMLGGGYFRAASVLITGFPGTAKSTLSGAFAEAACARGERTLLVSFDSDANEVVRNLASVGIQLERFVKNGLLRLISARTIVGSAEIHFMRIKNLAREHGARCVIIDPISALAKSSGDNIAHSVAERLVDWTKAEGITLLCTSLLNELGPNSEGTPLQISTIADTWIHLNYLVHAGERNRGISIIKSRGTKHSNQVRELVLSDDGVTLADAYTAGGEVLMGTLRWEKEREVQAAQQESELLAQRKQALLEIEEAELQGRLNALQREISAKRAEKAVLDRVSADGAAEQARGRTRLNTLRGADKK